MKNILICLVVMVVGCSEERKVFTDSFEEGVRRQEKATAEAKAVAEAEKLTAKAEATPSVEATPPAEATPPTKAKTSHEEPDIWTTDPKSGRRIPYFTTIPTSGMRHGGIFDDEGKMIVGPQTNKEYRREQYELYMEKKDPKPVPNKVVQPSPPPAQEATHSSPLKSRNALAILMHVQNSVASDLEQAWREA